MPTPEKFLKKNIIPQSNCYTQKSKVNFWVKLITKLYLDIVRSEVNSVLFYFLN